MDIRIHWFAPFNGISGEEQKPPKTLDLIKLKIMIWAAHLDAIFLDQKRDKIAAIVAAITLNATNFVKE